MRWCGFVFLLAACSLSAQTSVVPEIQYRSVPDFLHLPADLYFGEVAGVESPNALVCPEVDTK